MSATEISLVLKAYDEASSVFSSASQNIDSALGQVDSSTKQVTQSTNSMGDAYAKASSQTDEINRSYEAVGESAKKTSVSTMDLVGAGNTLALSGLTLALSFERVEKASLASDKANLIVTKGLERVELLTRAASVASEKYGADSVQAKDAQDKLAIATEQLSIAQERQGIVSNDLNQTYMQTALSIIPSVIGIFTSFSAVKKMLTESTVAQNIAEEAGAFIKLAAVSPTMALTVASAQLSAAMDANPIMMVVLALVAIGAALVAAYNFCPPFRDAIDAIGKALGDGLGQALAVVKGALEWLWNNVLVPLGNYIIGTFMAAINWLGEKLGWLAGPLKTVGDAFGWLAGVVGGAINAVGAKIDEYNGMMKAAEESTKNGLGVMENYYTDKYDSMTAKVDEALSKQLETIVTKNQEQLAAENAAYQEDISAFTDCWDKKLLVTQTELQTIDQKINDFYNKQITDAQAATQKQIDVLQGVYNKELTDFNAFWDTKDGTTNTELDKAKSVINTHYDNELSDLKTAYDAQVSATNTLYDDMLTATNAGLSSLRAAHQQSNDDQELLMLEQKVSLEQAYAAGLIDVTTYNTQVADLTKAYNTQRGLDQDAFRLSELQLEQKAKADGITIEQERASALTEIASTEASKVTGINAKRDTDLTTAAQQYSQITQTDFQTLTAAILSLRNSESAQTLSITNKRDADLKTAADQYTDMQTAHYNTLVALANEKANAIADSEKAAAQTKKDALASIEASINSDMSISAEQKKSIIANMNASCLADTQTQWSNIAGTIQAAMDKINNQNSVFQSALNAGKISADEYAIALEFQNTQANNLAAQAQWNAQNAGFSQALNSGQISQTQYNSAMANQNSNKPAGLVEGGTAGSDMWALVGEVGPELLHLNKGDSVIPLPKGGASGSSSSPQNQQITFAPGSITISIANVSSDADLAQIPRLVSEGVAEAYRRINY